MGEVAYTLLDGSIRWLAKGHAGKITPPRNPADTFLVLRHWMRYFFYPALPYTFY